MEVKDNSKICILIVPHTKKIKRILIPHWLPKATIYSLASFFLILFLFFGKTSKNQLDLKQEADEKSSIIVDLEEENKKKEEELANLKSQTEILRQKTNEVENKLLEIDRLQRRLEKMAGIDSPSRGGDISRDIHTSTLSPDEEMDVIADVLIDKKLELENFIEDLEAQFDYLEAMPDLMPTSGRVTSKFGYRRNPFGRGTQFHSGIDIANSSGTNIKSAGKGVVTFAGVNSGYGRTVIIDHGYGYKTLYAHNKQILVKVGDKVEKGQLISKMGSTGRSTGVHLHFEIHKNNKPINPYNVLN